MKQTHQCVPPVRLDALTVQVEPGVTIAQVIIQLIMVLVDVEQVNIPSGMALVLIVVLTVLIVNLREIQGQICVTFVKTDLTSLKTVNALKKSVIQINTCTNPLAMTAHKIVLSAEFHVLMEAQPVVHHFNVTVVEQDFRLQMISKHVEHVPQINTTCLQRKAALTVLLVVILVI